MAHSLLIFRDHAFNYSDAAIVAVAGLILKVSENTDLRPNVAKLFGHWRTQFPDAYGGGLLSPDLDDYLKEQADIDAMLALIERVRRFIAALGVTVEGEVLSEAATKVLGYRVEFNAHDSKKVLQWVNEWSMLLGGEGGEKLI